MARDDNGSRSRRRSGGRDAKNAAAAATSAIKQLPRGAVRNPITPIEPLSADQIEMIHHASLRILSEVGMEILGDDAKAVFKAAGVEVKPDTDLIKFDPAFIEESIKTAPSTFKLHARNADRTVSFGEGYINFCPVASAPNATDADRGRRQGNWEDFRNLTRLTQSLNCMSFIPGYPVEPTDIDRRTRHLEAMRDFSFLSDMAFHNYSLGPQRTKDGLDLARIVRGNISEEQFFAEPSIMTIVNTNSPLKLDSPMGHGIIEHAKHGQISVVTPFTLAGAMAPVTIAGALAQQNAEFLVGLSLAQCAKPGAPVVYGGFTSNVDMKTGAPAFGTPEYVKAAQAGGQLTRRYGVPYRSSGVCAANIPDAQAAWETQMSLWATMTGGADMVMHAAGWMEGGLSASFEKMVIDADMIQMLQAYMQPIEVSDATLGLDAIADVGPGGHFFGTLQTMERFETAFYAPMLSDWRNYETWSEDGSKTAYQRANKVYKQLLAEYEEPAIDPATKDAINEFVDRRIAEGGSFDDD
jgi:trimethylamine---corrinoid protein Co-methyltransferase